ncbi:xanthine dehydrogenase family protein subunit M [Thioclava sp. BHET1]|nr:xanthine dehydrogenase family protein subunit M [Thioclava sp. BHET1]
MKDFSYHRALNAADASAAAAQEGAMLLAGGTTLLDLAKCGVVDPEAVIDITHISGMDAIEIDAQAIRLGALARMAQVADHAGIRTAAPAVAEALALAASAQIRNMASLGGNLMQRTRCAYFRDPATFPACNKRHPGSGCAAEGGITRNHAVLGASAACTASYPGDLAVALVALDAVIETARRQVRAEDFFLSPGDTPERETVLNPGEIITAILIPQSAIARRSTYLKVRDRQSYEFAAASAAVGLDLTEDGVIADIRVALGGVATRPWRAHGVEAALKGRRYDPLALNEACALAVSDARGLGDNDYKIDLAPRVVKRAILKLGEME